MAAAGWLVSGDGCLRCEEGLRSLAYHPALNAVLAVTDKATVKVIDGTSGTVLQLSALAAKPGQQISCHYLPGVDKVVFTDGYAVGCRKDLNGILLLDTALQPPVSKQDDHVQLELPLSEAQQLLSVCQKKIDVSGTEGCDDFMAQLREGVKIATQEPPVNHKVAKWATVKICLPHYQLKTVAGAVVSELKRLGLYAAALPVAASFMDRLSYLLPSAQGDLGGGPGRPLDRTLMFSEANRRETFTSWPHPNYRWAQPDPMAQAGFYHQPTTNGDDRAMCFTCSVCLVSWEPTDEPWSEHERHSPNCPYVKGEHTQNVPLSVTLATGPAQLLATGSNDAVACLGFGICPRLLAAATRQGHVCIWDISQQMKVKARFCLNPRDPLIALNFTRTERTSPDEEDSTKPCLTWTDDTSSSSDVPRLESDSDDQLEDSDCDQPSGSDLIIGDSCKDDMSSGIAMEVTALTILQQPERSFYDAGPSTTDGITKDSRSTGFGVNDRNKDQPVATPLPCLLASALVTSKCTTSLTENSDPISESEPRVLSSGESSPAQVMETGSSLIRGLGGMVSTRTVPLLLVYVVRGIEEKATPLLDALLGKGTPDEEGGAGGTFPLPHLLGVDPEQQPQLFMQEPVHLTYVQQLAQATQGLATTADRKTDSNGAGSNGSTIAGTPRPGTLVQCLPLPPFAEAEGMYVQELAPCPDGIHVLALLRPHEGFSDAFYYCSNSPAAGSTALFSPNRVEQKNRLNSVLRGEDDGAVMSKYASCTDRSQCGPLQSTVLNKTTENGHFFDGGCGGYCLIYRLGCGGRLATLQPEPVATHRFASPDDTATSMILLPADVLNGHEDDVEDATIGRRVSESSAGTTGERSPTGSLGHLVITTRVGFIKVIDIGTFETLAVVNPPNRDGAADPFVSLIYCSGTDRLCACTQGGEIHFLQIGETQDDIDSSSIFQDGSTTREEKFQDENKHTSGSHNQGLSGLDLLALEPLIADTLSTMLELTRFETLTPRFAATVPPCWAEVQQEQQQRRHPQHLHGQRQGDAAQHTRTWKLHADSKSWYEHVFEIVLPKVCAVGHVDFKFVLHPDVTSIPPVQVTLLRNRSPGLGKSTDVPVDAKVTFPLSPPAWLQASPASSDTSDDLCEAMDIDEDSELGTRKFCPFLEEHKEDILCGPVWLGHGIDLSAHAGTLTLTSPKLIRGGKHRSFLLHMHAVLGDKATEEGGRSTNRSPMCKPPAVQGHSLVSFLLKATAFKVKGPKKLKKQLGCDMLQEISITIRKFKRTSIPRDRLQRLAMLELPDFSERLLAALCSRGDHPPATDRTQRLLLDLLCWHAGAHSHSPASSREGMDSLLIKTKLFLVDLIRVCFLEAGRSVAHKCARFLALCLGSGRTESSCRAFDKALLRALLANLSYIPAAATAGALHWYFVLLNYVKEEDLEESSTACASLLSMVSRQLTDRLTPQEALLRARYGLYRSPFDPMLFDIEMSGSSYKNAFVVSSSSIQSEEIDLSEIMTGPSGPGRVAVGAAAESSFTALTGLLEVEPLHFGCVATSDGTRVEKDKRGSVFGVVAPAGPPAGATGTCETNQLLSSAAQAALHSLSTAMASAEQQLQALHEKQQQLLNLQQQKAKLEAKLHQTAAACAAASAATSSTLSSHPMLVFPPTPKTTPLFMTPPLTPPNEVALCSSELLNNGDLAKLYTNSCLTDQSTVLVLQSKQATGKTKGQVTTTVKAAYDILKSSPAEPLPTEMAHSISQASLLLQPPAHQSMVIERMHAGARRFVTLDFGRLVLLTDVLIPACPDLSSLAVDIWARGEEVDGCRLVMAPDIGTHALILHDLLPPPICRFVKITVIGKYGGTNVRAKVPLGLYYGHTYILPWEPEGHAAGEGPGLPSSLNGQPEVEQQLATLLALQEDFQFRYNLACHRLELLLQAVDLPPLSSAAGGHHFLLRPERAVRDDTRVCAAYQACAQLQLQLNLAQHAVRRLRGALGLPPSELHRCGRTDDPVALVLRSSTEQLCTVIKYLLDTLLSLLHTSNGNEVPAGLRQAFHAEACQDLFKHLCLSGTPRIRLHAGLLLAQLCGGEPWWGSFLANVLHELYNSQQLLVFPHDRVFILLSCLGRRSLSNSGVLESLLSLLDRLLNPLQVSFSSQHKAGILDIPLVSWVLMLISRLMDCVTSADEEGGASALGGRKLPLDKELERLLAGNQWSFVTNSFQSQNPTRATKNCSKIRKQLLYHKQQLSILKAKQKVLVEQIDKEKSQSNKGPSYKLLVEQAKLKQATSKHFKDLLRLRRASEWPRTTVSSSVEPNETQGAIGWEGVPEPEPLAFALAHEQCLPVVRKLLAFLLAMDFTCHADLFLFVCKVLARLATCTRPAIYLSDLATETQLERLFMLVVGSDFNKGTVTWGGAWAQHALICMLQDILIGELQVYGAVDAVDEGSLVEDRPFRDVVTVSIVEAEDDPQPSTSFNLPDIPESEPVTPDITAVPPSPSSMDKDKDLDMLQDFSELHVLPFDVDLDEDLHATKVFKPASSSWPEHWGWPDNTSFGYPPQISSMSKPCGSGGTNNNNGNGSKSAPNIASVLVSQAVDARLEVGLEQQAELALKMMATVAADSVLRALTATSPATGVTRPSSSSAEAFLQFLQQAGPSVSAPMLSACFNRLFASLQLHQVQLGSLLHLWLTLSQTMGPAAVVETGSELYSFSACRQPAVPLSQGSISSLLATLAWQPNTSLVTWCLALQSLALMTNLPPSGSESIAQDMVSDTNLVAALHRFLSGRSIHTTSSCQEVGPTVLHALQGLLSRLQIHLSSSHPGLFNEFLLRLVHMLSTDSGSFQMGTGPLDAQLKLLDFSLEQSFEAVSVGTILSVIESAAALVHPYIASGERLTTRSGLDGSVASRSCFSGLFGHAGNVRAADARHLGMGSEVTRDGLVFGLLRLVNLLAPLPLTSDGRQSMKQPSAGSTSGTIFTGSVSDEEKASCGGSREMECSGSKNAQRGCVADLVLANQQVMSQILAALSQCNSNTMAMIIGASGLHLGKQESLQGGLEAVSVGDGLFCILSTLGQRASSPQLLLQPILTYMACGYMGRQGSLATCQMSEPLLWYILRVLDSTESLKTFLDMGGVQLICNNMVTSTRAMLNTSRSMVSTIMRCLDVGHGRGADGNMRARFLAADTDASEGLHNFAPYGTITSTSPTAQPAEVLLQATPPHRRARSAAWSYIFLPEESWCDLTVHLPAAILLREIHIQPHIASLATCPSAVSVEVSADGVNMLPVASPVVTAGQTYIKLQLVHAEVVTAVCLRLHRPRDSGTLGLSQIKLLGLTAFGCMSCSAVTNPFLPTEDQVSKSSIGWLRLLHHCMTHVAELEGSMASAAAPTANLLQTCAALLVSPYCGMHAPSIEAVLIGLGLQSTSMGLRLVHTLLRDGSSCTTHPADLNSPLLMGRLNGLSSDSTVDILFQLGTTQDTGTHERVQALISWVKDCAQLAVRNSTSPTSPSLAPNEHGLLAPSPSHVHCIAAVLWYSLEQQVGYNLPGMMGPELFQVVLSWSSCLPSALPLKKAVDWLLCALCHVQPVNFAMLLTSLGVPRLRARSSPSAAVAAGLSLTDDTKKAGLRAGQTDDSKRGAALALASLDAGQLATLAAASQSPEATQQLLDSGFPACLAHALVDCCLGLISTDQPQYEELLAASKPPSLTARMIAPVLRFFTEVGSSHSMKDWLGGPEGQPMWSALLSLLCHASVPAAASVMPGTALRCSQLPPADGVLSTQGRSSIENAAVAFFAQCICCHPANQKLMAQVLCELFQTSAPRGNMSVPGTISGFARRLFLQLMLEDENVTVFLQSPCPLYKGRVNAISHVVQHPMYGAGHKFRTMSLTVSATLANVLNRVSDTPRITAKLFDGFHDEADKNPSKRKEKGELDSGMSDTYGYAVVVASGLKSQSKRISSTGSMRPPTRRGRAPSSDKTCNGLNADSVGHPVSVPVLQLHHPLLPGLSPQTNLVSGSFVAQVSQEHGQNEPEQFEWVSLDPSGDTSTIDFPEFLAFETNHSVPPPPSSSVPTGGNGGGGTGSASTTTSSAKSTLRPPVMCPVPPHSLAAFGLFLRLPGYAEVLLRERRHAQRLLRLVLGVVDDGKGNHILQSPSASVLPTLPFQVLRTLLVSTPLTTDDGVLLRRMALDVGALHLLLACLAALSHHSPRGGVVPATPPAPSEMLIQAPRLAGNTGGSSGPSSSSGEEQQLYWAKGTGFGTGSTTSGWDVEQALSKQRMEEEHVTCLLQVLASYINPNSSYPTLAEVSNGENQSHSPLPAVLSSLFSQSCLLPAIASYLRNDSVLDMARHVPLYRALLELLRSMAQCSPLIPLLLPSVSSGPNGGQDHDEVEKQEDRGVDEDEEGVEATSTVSQASISALLAKMKICVDTYSSRLRSKKEKEKTNGKAEAPEPEAEGLTLLVPDIQRTADIVQKATTMLQQATRADKQSTTSVLPKNRSSYVGKSLQERYIGTMKDLQFDTFEMVVDKNDKPVFRISHHYASQVKTSSDGQSAARARRLAQEAVTLSTSLPLSASSSVFVRCDEERLDVMKVLITGPADTPYANGCFEFDVYFPQDYPKSPPLVNLETTGQNSIRFNPNLYNDGKVCLSILNTWHGRPEEKWNPQTSSFLQVLVSIQSLILVAEPYFNEPGYERSRGTPSGAQSSREYDANIRQATVKWAMLEQLCNPSPCFKEVILRHFYLKRMEVMAHCEEWIADIQQYSADKRVGRTMAHHAAALKRHASQLRDVLLKLQCPEGLEFPEQMNEATGHSWLLGTESLDTEPECPKQQPEISGPSWLMDAETEGATGSEGAYGGADFDPVEPFEVTTEAAAVAADPLPKAYYGP
uniref:baculoviral IAP repeat-containing protein 6 n=1 Tax=Myxine glutinosa TaxID=7769 RepID=UPI00358FA005